MKEVKEVKEERARRLVTFVTGVLFSLLALAFAMTPAGTVIRNQAMALVEGERYLSNPVETVVRPLCLPSLTPNGTPASPGQEAGVSPDLTVIPHRAPGT
ncbi:MAG: hypothetical protein ACK4G4_10640 [Thermus sp.]|uniref:hypothetical protein n=1 Tax=Thermus sp. TaxID=275 RepID=UPI00391DF90F